MDRGIPTEETLAEMRAADPPVQYLVGVPKGRLSRLERDLVGKPWQKARPASRSSSCPDGELYVFAQSLDRSPGAQHAPAATEGLWAPLKSCTGCPST